MQAPLALDELGDCIPAADNAAALTERMVIVECLNRFLDSLPQDTRILFLRRYWYWRSVRDLASDFGITESKVKMVLMRTRNDLRLYLEKEGIVL